jgi:hypothetical protein
VRNVDKMELQEVKYVVMDWNDQFQDRDRWRALINTVINIWFP